MLIVDVKNWSEDEFKSMLMCNRLPKLERIVVNRMELWKGIMNRKDGEHYG